MKVLTVGGIRVDVNHGLYGLLFGPEDGRSTYI
jgi:hypothetical protein